jgi:DNA excision repair protein ERCC-4
LLLCHITNPHRRPPGRQIGCRQDNRFARLRRTQVSISHYCFFLVHQPLTLNPLTTILSKLHRISETSIESFIIRVFREKNQSAFLKAFCEDPEALTGGQAKLERLMKVLYVTKLYLWPRFRVDINQALASRVAPNVIELSISLSSHMKAIQSAILVAINTCVNELKKACPQLEMSHLTLENGLFSSFDHVLKSQLDPDWHKISIRTKQLVNDITTLRRLLDYLIRYDAFSFYYVLLKLQVASGEQLSPSLW